MVINNEIRIQYKIRKESRLHPLLDSIWRNIRNHDKKENDVTEQRKNLRETSPERKRTRPPCTEIQERTMDIS